MAPAQPELKKVCEFCRRTVAFAFLCLVQIQVVSPTWESTHKIESKLTYSQYLEKRLFVQLNGSRKVIGVLRGYDVLFP